MAGRGGPLGPYFRATPVPRNSKLHLSMRFRFKRVAFWISWDLPWGDLWEVVSISKSQLSVQNSIRPTVPRNSKLHLSMRFRFKRVAFWISWDLPWGDLWEVVSISKSQLSVQNSIRPTGVADQIWTGGPPWSIFSCDPCTLFLVLRLNLAVRFVLKVFWISWGSAFRKIPRRSF